MGDGVGAVGAAEAVWGGTGVGVTVGDADAVGAAVAVGDGGAVGTAVWVGVTEGVGVAVGDAGGVGLAGCEGVPDGSGPMAGADGDGAADDEDCGGAGSTGSGTVGSVAPGFSGFSGDVPSVDGPSGPQEGPMFGTGGGVSITGSTAMGLPGIGLAVSVSGVGTVVGSTTSPTAGVSAEGAASGVVLDSGAVRPDSTLEEGMVLPLGPASVAGRIWLEAATQRASAPASTMEAGTASFFTITPRILVAPRYGRGSTCPGTIVPRGRPDNAWGLGRMGYF